MIVRTEKNSVDLTTINTFSDVNTMIESLTSEEVLWSANQGQVLQDYEVRWDQLTGHEIALINLTATIGDEYRKLERKVIPSPSEIQAMRKLMNNGRLTKEALPPVDSVEYENLQKLGYLRTFLEGYCSLVIQCRVGFGVNLRVLSNGDLAALKDLRNIYDPPKQRATS